MISKKTDKLMADAAALQAKITKARAEVQTALDQDQDGARLPRLRADVDVLVRRLEDVNKALHLSRVADCHADIKAATAAHAEALKAYHAGKARHFDEMIKAHPSKPSVGREMAKNRKFAPEWLSDLRRARHESYQKLLERYEDLRSLDPAEARKLGWSRLADYIPPAAPVKTDVE